MLDGLSVVDHRGIVVNSLPRQDLPVIETGGVTDQMPFTDQGGGIPGPLQQFGESLLATIKTAVGIVVETVSVGIHPGQDGGPTGTADRVGDEAAIKPHPFPSNPVHVRSVE